MLTGRLLRRDRIGPGEGDLGGRSAPLYRAVGEPVLRQAVTAAMRILGDQFVMGRTIEEALARAREAERQGYRHSFDMLGEAARTMPDAARYLDAYEDAIAAIGTGGGRPRHRGGPGHLGQALGAAPALRDGAARARDARIAAALLGLARQARDAGIGFTIDAEEADRLELSLDLLERWRSRPELAGWDGLGLAVQAYQKRALPLLDWLADLARRARRRLMVRLVKGAYWDTEIKRAQERGLDGYPVFTRKVATDVSYLACAKRMLAGGTGVLPAIRDAQRAHASRRSWKWRGGPHRLRIPAAARHGRGALRRDRRPRQAGPAVPHLRAGRQPRGPARLSGAAAARERRQHLVRQPLVDEREPIDELVADPVARLARLAAQAAPAIPLPRDIFAPARRNSQGIDLADPRSLCRVAERPRGGGAPAVDAPGRSSAASS